MTRVALVSLLLVAFAFLAHAHVIPNDISGAIGYTEKIVQVPAFQSSVIQADFYLRTEDDPNILIQVRNKRKASLHKFKPSNVILFVHGATYPSETSYDLQLGGMSWMELQAMQGYDTYWVNVRSYGNSTRLPNTGLPIVRTPTASADFGTAAKFILKRRNISKLNVMGWSWGTSIVTHFTTNNPTLVNRLVIYAPQWYRNWQTSISGSYRNTSIVGRRASWLYGVPADKADGLIPAGWFEAWVDVCFNQVDNAFVDANGLKYVSTPSGITYDNNEFWYTNTPLYDSSKINMPTLVIRAEWDSDLNVGMALGYYQNITNAPYKKLVQISEGTHQVLLERNRMLLFREVAKFLKEESAVPLGPTDYDL